MIGTEAGRRGTVYLLHLAAPVGGASHYVGFTTDLARRLRQHRAGRGGRLPAAAARRGVAIEVARTWEGAGRAWEARLHRYGALARLCPRCSGDSAMRRMRGNDAVQ